MSTKAPAHIDEHVAMFHQLKRLRTDDVLSFRGERGVQREYVAVSHQYEEVFRILHSVLLCPFVIGEWIIGQHSHPEPAKNLRRDAAGLARAYNTGSLAVEVEAHKSPERTSPARVRD